MSPINLTIKTLDSRNHPFENLDPEMSIRQLKEKISPTVSIPPERQRLIYCGRVLDDEKKLKDHALDGKVLHLVSRQPLSARDVAEGRGFESNNHRSAANGPTGTGGHTGPTPDVNITIHHAPPFRAGGSNPVRAEMTRSSATIRLQLASRMLRRANGIIDSLDHPGREEEATTATTTTSTNTTTTTRAADPPAPSDLSSLFAFNATGGETVIGTMAIQIETNGNNTTPGAAVIVQNGGLAPLQRIFQRLEQQQQNQSDATSANTTTNETPASSGTSTTVGGGSTTASTRTTTSSSSNDSSSTTSTTASTTIEHPPPNALALVVEEYNRTNARLAPYTERMIQLLRNDPELSESVVREHQIFYNYVTQAMHFMSHAQHAMSDILFNLSTPTPRVIRARPFLLHRPAFQNVAISATATPASRTTQSRPSTATTAAPTSSTPPSGGGGGRGSSGSSNSGGNSASTAGSGAGVGFTVEARPIIVGIPNVRPGNNRAFIASETEFISNMIRATLGGIQNAVAGNNQGSGMGTSTTSSPQQSASTLASSANSSSNVNSRGTSSSQRSSSDMNSGTQPTTSTRTRSSPHVRYAATPMSAINPSTQMGHLNNFDPFLQCNSHHILGGRSGGMPGGVTGRWSTFGRHPIRRRTRHPAGFQIHHGAQQRSSSVPPNPGAAPNNAAAAAATAPTAASSSSTPSTSDEERRSDNAASNTNTQPATAPRSEEAPYLRRMALAQGIRELVLDQVMNYNAPPNAASSAPPSSNDDQVMFNIIQGILRYFVGALDLQAAEGNSSVNTVSTGNETMEQFLRSLPDYNYVEGESVITDLLMTIIRHLTFRDLVTWIFGGGDRIINQFREPLAAFVRGQLSQNDNIEESVTGFLDSYYPQVEEISNLASVSPDIDFAETLHNFMSERLLILVQIVLRETEVDSFGRDISRQVSDLFTGLTALGMHSFTDGPASIERVVQSQLGALCGHGLGPVARDQLMSIATGHLRNYIGGLGANNSQEEDISRYIIKKGPDADRRKSERNKRIASQNNQANNANVEDERFVTPPSSPEVMDVEEEDSSNSKAPDSAPDAPPSSSSSIPEDVLPVDPNQKFPSELLKMAQGPDMVIGSETWHKSLPTEWVPIITRDISRQQRNSNPRKSSTTPPSSSNATVASTSSSSSSSSSDFVECIQESFVQAPFSDAYLSSQSAKRRKLAAAKKPEVGSDLENVIAESLNEALSETGVVTLVDVDTIAGSPDVVRSVEVKTKNVIKEKLSKDLDFANSPESRFRSSKAFSSSKD